MSAARHLRGWLGLRSPSREQLDAARSDLQANARGIASTPPSVEALAWQLRSAIRRGDAATQAQLDAEALAAQTIVTNARLREQVAELEGRLDTALRFATAPPERPDALARALKRAEDDEPAADHHPACVTFGDDAQCDPCNR